MNKKLVLILSIFGFLSSFMSYSASLEAECLVPIKFCGGGSLNVDYNFLCKFKSGLILDEIRGVEGGKWNLALHGIDLSFLGEEEIISLFRLPVNFHIDPDVKLVGSDELFENLRRHLALESTDSLSSLLSTSKLLIMEESLSISLKRILQEKRCLAVARKRRLKLASILAPTLAGLAFAVGWFVKKR